VADPIVALIVQRARRYGVDPRAALAVASVEGGLHAGGVGDSGTSYGPFQLHVGGALPRGRGAGWANSPAGIDYALRQMARTARGLRGRAAIAAIVRNFERPADIPGEITKASGRLGQFGDGGLSTSLSSGAGAVGRNPGLAAVPGSSFAPALMSVLASNNDLIGVPTPALDFTTPAPAAAPPSPQTRTVQTRGGRNVNLVRFARGADRAGVRTSRAVRNFVVKIAAAAGHPLVIGTGTNHNRMTVNGNVSDHWSGHAGDIPATGRELIRLGQLALIAAGANPAWARRQRGGLFNVGGHQIIFNTMQGGDHTNHLHVSAR
jgi:hypothetical protein